MLSRNVTVPIWRAIDQLVPPILRDSWLFNWLLIRPFVEAETARTIMAFKEALPTENGLTALYGSFQAIKRDTDTNELCLRLIEREAVGTKLDVGCGTGYLAKRIGAVGVDVAPSMEGAITAPCHRLPFPDGAFDTVICAHTLEHVLDLQASVAELRRVCAAKLIIIVPRQRPYRYTPDLHVHFFPYVFNLLVALRPTGTDWDVSLVGGDWCYIERL